MSSKIKNATKVLVSVGLLFATALPFQSANATNPQTRKYKIDARAKIIGCFDGAVSRSDLEVFGEAEIDSKRVGGINQNNWRRRGCGEGVQILKNYTYTATAGNHTPKLKIKLFDRDGINDNDKIGDFTIPIPLTGNRKYTKTKTWGKPGKWEVGSELSVTVTPLSSPANPQPNREIRVSDGNKKIIKKNGEFWVNGKQLGTGKWISSTRYVVFVKQWGNRWWIGDLVPEGMLSTTVQSKSEIDSAKPSNLERYISK